ncbi:hypothetical protein [Kingella sp. (in: b-proteobacteria)]|uniref:hypothetical protein n=1 Tax=Kingella sp. (in: b-proteobacteria) TaxID=2020713 RepID=UPI0026DB12FA|nr:hypothetical protein [Kingella sp. (in: b-proteobacteria)]MDO4656899.1 hypothetical protein [Kingella sp. (in: b-proteobacteria)]
MGSLASLSIVSIIQTKGSLKMSKAKSILASLNFVSGCLWFTTPPPQSTPQ